MKTVLLTGATGFVGRNVLSSLSSGNFEVHVIARSLFKSERMGKNQGIVHWHKADLLDFKQTAKIIEKIRPTHLLHLAWQIEHGKHWAAAENFQWVNASVSLFEQFAANGGERSVCAGTCFEYSLGGNIYREYETPIKPQTIYGKCKAACQLLFDALAQKNNISSAWGRMFFSYGKYDVASRLIPYVINSLLINRPAFCSHGDQIRDFLYIEDVADAFVKLLMSSVEGEVNIASGNPITLKEIIFKIGEIIGNPELIKLGAVETSLTEPLEIVADVKRLQTEVGWSQKWSLEDGLRETVAWWRENI